MSHMFDYLVNGGDELALTKAQLEHTSNYLGIEIEVNERLRWALEEIIQSADLDISEHGEPSSGWFCISTHLIEQARAALTGKTP